MSIEFEERGNVQNIRLKREIVIETSKNDIIFKLSHLIAGQEREFLLLCQRLEQKIRLEFRARRDKLMEFYDCFDPIEGSRKMDHILSDSQVKLYQESFLERLSEIMKESNFKVLTEREWNIATSSQYLFHLPTKINERKLDDKLFVGTQYYQDGKALGRLYVIFRRGIGIDRKSGLFLGPKLDEMFKYLWKTTIMRAWNWLGSHAVNSIRSNQEDSTKSSIGNASSSLSDDKYICVRRVHVKNSFSFRYFFDKLDLQEPTFDHMIIIYRKATSRKDTSCRGDLGIYIKHFKGIPMADMELILPAKRHPRLPAKDWVFLLLFAVIAAVTIVSALNKRNLMSIVVVVTVAFVSYCAKVYLTYNMNVLQYERRINKLMEDKQLDCGHASLLYLLEEAIQQEAKEAIIAYFVLLTRGKANEQELRRRCDDLIIHYFENGTSEFEVKDALNKLTDLGIVVPAKDDTGRYESLPMDKANEKIHEKILKYLQSDEQQLEKLASWKFGPNVL